LWTEEEIDEWNAAMAEYEALHGPIGEEKIVVSVALAADHCDAKA